MSYKIKKGNNFENFPEIWQLCAAMGLQTPCRGSLGFMKDTASDGFLAHRVRVTHRLN